MKKIIIRIILAMILLTPVNIYSADLKVSLGLKTNSIESPVYSELSITQSFDILSIFATYQVGYDVMNNTGYSTILLGASLSFKWGDICMRKEYGSNVNKTEVRLEF